MLGSYPTQRLAKSTKPGIAPSGFAPHPKLHPSGLPSRRVVAPQRSLVVPWPPEQAPPLQAEPIEQKLPHSPQWLALVFKSTQAPAQKVRPSGHTQPLAPAHMLPPVHAAPHAPQWSTSESRSTQRLSQTSCPGGHRSAV